MKTEAQIRNWIANIEKERKELQSDYDAGRITVSNYSDNMFLAEIMIDTLLGVLGEDGE